MKNHENTAEIIRRLARIDNRKLARWEAYIAAALATSVALWVVLEAVVGALTRGPA